MAGIIKVLAKIDQTNVDPTGNLLGDKVIFDGFKFTNFVIQGDLPSDELSDDDIETRYPIIVFEVSKEDIGSEFNLSFESISLDWYEIELSEDGSIVVNFGLEDAPSLKILSIRKAEQSISERLEQLIDLPIAESNDNNEIFTIITKEIDYRNDDLFVTIVDVGQGSLAALHSNNDKPVLFFDLGWPTIFQATSKPSYRPRLVALRAPVVLSHWDWDHWGLAIEQASWNRSTSAWKITWDSDVLRRPWIVPGVGKSWGGVSLTPLHWRFALALKRTGMSYRWPNAIHCQDFNKLSIFRSIGGTLGDRNQHGLVMVVDNLKGVRPKGGRKIPAVLLPGDVNYSGLPFLRPRARNRYQFTGLVATHHGARFDVKCTPKAVELHPKLTHLE